MDSSSTSTPLDPSEGIALFTDGSANYKNRSGGWAYLALDAFEGLTADSGYESDTTISQMELMAVIKGLNYLEKYGACEILVYSDSEYVVLGARDKTRKRNKNKHLWNWLDDAIRVHEYVEFIHVRGHSDHLYNEMVDQMAGAARRKGIDNERKASS